MARPRNRANAAAAGRAKAKKLVLLVDDFADGREMYAEYLSYRGFDVEVAVNGAEAVDKARAKNPDVILMDLSLPLIDGWTATKLLKADARTQNIPVIALTGHVLDDSDERARAAGCDGYLPKPCLPPDVEKGIRRLLSRT